MYYLGNFQLIHKKNNFVNFAKDQVGPIFINVQQCIEKLHIKQTSLLLNQNVNIDEFDVNTGHQCTFCDYKFCEECSEIFDNLENSEPSLSNEIKMAIVYIWSMVIFCFILFHTIKEKVCYKSLSNIFMLISEFHFFNTEKKYASIFANIVLKNFWNFPRIILFYLSIFLRWLIIIYTLRLTSSSFLGFCLSNPVSIM